MKAIVDKQLRYDLLDVERRLMFVRDLLNNEIGTVQELLLRVKFEEGEE